jgi:hypothetical protein
MTLLSHHGKVENGKWNQHELGTVCASFLVQQEGGGVIIIFTFSQNEAFNKGLLRVYSVASTNPEQGPTEQNRQASLPVPRGEGGRFLLGIFFHLWREGREGAV